MAANLWRCCRSTTPVVRVATFWKPALGSVAHLVADDFFATAAPPAGRVAKNTRNTELGVALGMNLRMTT